MEGSLEEKKLELRLGPPGEEEEYWTLKINSRERNESLLSLGCFSNGTQTHKFSSSENPFLHFQTQTAPKSMTVMEKESSQHYYTRVADLKNSEKKAFSPVPANTAVPNSSQKRRTTSTPVVGWPPVRSFRKNLSSISSSKPQCQLQNVISDKYDSRKQIESCQKGLFVKINMEGVPIGRKVDLKAYESYEKLSSGIDELFRGLLAAQEDQNKQSGEKAITGLLDGSGEYTLVYEDNEGDRMLVGDVPWHMFVSTVKRLWVLKSSELSTLRVGSKQEKR